MQPIRFPFPVGFSIHSGLLLLCAAPIGAQQPGQPRRVEVLRGAVLEGLVPGPGAAVTSAADPKPKKKAPAVDATRMKMLKPLVLDRRPSTVLATWASPEPKAVDKDPELALPKPLPKAPVAPKAPVPPGNAAPAKAPAKAPAAGAATPEKDAPVPAKDPATPSKDVATPAKGAAGTAKDAATPAKGGGNPEKDATAPAKGEAATAKGSPAPAKGDAPAKAATTPTTPAKDSQGAAAGSANAKPDAAADEKMKKAMAAHAEAMAKFAKDNAEYNKLKAAYAKKKKVIDAKRLKREMEILARHVTLGRWNRLPAALEKFGRKGAEQAYLQILAKLAKTPKSPGANQYNQFGEKNSFSFDDVLALTGIAPGGLKKKHAKAFPALLKLAYARGHSFDGWLARLRAEIAKPEKERRFDRRLAALFLAAERKNLEMGEFLPTIQEAQKAEDREALNLLSRHHMAEHAKDQKPAFLEKAWTATLASLAVVDKPVPVPGIKKVDASAKPSGKPSATPGKKVGGPAVVLDPAAKAAADKAAALAAAEAEAERIAAEKEAKAKIAAAKKLAKAQKDEALLRATELAPKVRDELGEAWLEESFTINPKRGMEVIAAIGGQASKGMVSKAYNAPSRLKGLQLLKSAVDALLAHAPERADEWRESLNLLAGVWLREASHAYRYSKANRMGPYAERDRYGNIYWTHYGSSYFNSSVNPLEPAQLLELRPDGKWRSMLEDSVRAKYDTTIAELYLKVNEEKLAFPYIEQLAKTDIKRANELAKEFINVWIRNNDPNSTSNRTNIYSYSFGYSRQASGIPLTRSKQERNLRDLAAWVAKLRGVPNIKLDTKLLVKAFTASHSAAEVYRVETMESVFGALDDLEPKVLAQMAQTMRVNLATTWRVPAVQQKAGTKRKQKDIQAEVIKGYDMAQAVLSRAIESHPDEWTLKVARAAMIHDLNNFKNKIKKSKGFSATRKSALKLFGEAVEAYCSTIAGLPTNEESVQAFEFWFNAALGASDVPAIDQDTILARHELPKLKAALDKIPGSAGKRHRAKFANALFTRLSSVNPAVKNRFLEAGFAIVGDHPQAQSARKVYDYYRDLLVEIQMVASVEGSTDVGTEPFGMRIDLRYTKQIERESGGFSKYLQNQANNTNYSNYGRPPENYRDKFEESIRTTLEEQFEVMSVTFNSEDVNSKSTEELGWRRTPYAYVLLKAKGQEVDRIPPMKMDLDFLDVTGYVVLPLVSAVQPIDASAKPETRPFEDLSITQILDERKAKDGLLNLEIKADAKGLVPRLEDVLDVVASDFQVKKVVDQGVSVNRFGDDKDSIRTERLWVVSMEAKEGVENPTAFKFPRPLAEETEVLYQRYDDADLMVATAEVQLEGHYSEPSGFGYWWLTIPIGLLVAVGWLLIRKPKSVAESTVQRLPTQINPVTVLGLLRELRGTSSLDDAKRSELDETISQIERHFFGGWESTPPNLQQIAEHWVRRA